MRIPICLLLLLGLPGIAPADSTILTNARVYTVNPDQPWASSVVIEGGKIAWVGDDPSGYTREGAQVIDLGGKMVLPAFQDAHSHLASSGVGQITCPLYDHEALDAILDAIRACAEANPDAEIIRGEGWYISSFPGGMPPRKELLDAIDNTRPLAFDDADAHALWVNSKALEVYGITAETPNPPGGIIKRNPDTGELWGTLHEETAMNLVKGQWPAYTDKEILAGLRWAQDHFHSLGITATQDAIIKLDSRDPYRALPAYLALRDTGELKMRIALALLWESGLGIAVQTARFKAIADEVKGGHLRANMVKFWADGVVETHTALMLEPYSDDPSTRGLMMVPREELMAAVKAVDAAGLQVHIHAIGDATVRYGLDAIEAAWAANGRRDTRPHINHVQIVHPDDIGRFAELGVGASFEPLWGYEDEYITDFTRPKVGPERIQWTYPINSIMKTGAMVAFSSDWAVSSANPLEGIEVAITRMDPYSNEGEPFLPEQAINLAQAIEAYTLGAAKLGRTDDISGSIETGKSADLVVLDRNLFEISASEISDVRVTTTLFEGEVVYGSY